MKCFGGTYPKQRKANIHAITCTGMFTVALHGKPCSREWPTPEGTGHTRPLGRRAEGPRDTRLGGILGELCSKRKPTSNWCAWYAYLGNRT